MKSKKEYLKSRPITREEYDWIYPLLKPKYQRAIEGVYLYGKSLSEVCNKEGYSRRMLQLNLKKFNLTYMCLRQGFIATQLYKGFTIQSIRKDLGLSVREDLNKLMWENVRGDIRPSTRWRILKRDNFKCVLCGATSTDRKLHIDHIKPVCSGGKNDIKNLRVLCSSCNIGRNDDLEKII